MASWSYDGCQFHNGVSGHGVGLNGCLWVGLAWAGKHRAQVVDDPWLSGLDGIKNLIAIP